MFNLKSKQQPIVTAELLLDVTVQQIRPNIEYKGAIDGFGVPFEFEIVFQDHLVNFLKFTTLFGKILEVSDNKIGKVLGDIDKDKYEFKIVRTDGKLLDEDALTAVKVMLFNPIMLAVAMLDKVSLPVGAKKTFCIPCLCAEEMVQFRNAKELENFVDSLNT